LTVWHERAHSTGVESASSRSSASIEAPFGSAVVLSTADFDPAAYLPFGAV
jgi:hypothetical protein